MRRTIVLPLLAALALTACNDKKSPAEPASSQAAAPTSAAPTTPPPATASHDSAAGAMTGLLEAMRSGDNEAVKTWLSPVPEGDRASVTQVERMQSMLGLDGKVFWLVDERKIVDVSEDGDEAEVELDGYIVWCTGSGADDTDASCAKPNGSGDEQTNSYDAVKVEGQWYIRLDLNHGQLIDDNPGSAGLSA
jgi:glucose/arabinose dehydrogenase